MLAFQLVKKHNLEPHYFEPLHEFLASTQVSDVGDALISIHAACVYIYACSMFILGLPVSVDAVGSICRLHFTCSCCGCVGNVTNPYCSLGDMYVWCLCCSVHFAARMRTTSKSR